MKLRRVLIRLNEGKIEKAAEQFLSQIVKNSPFKGKVYIAGGYVRDEFMGLDPKDIDIVVELPQGGIKFADYVTKQMGNYKKGSNPVVYPKFGTAKFNLKGNYKGIDLSGVEVEAVMSRSEQYTRGSRKPDVKPGTLKQDVERRDFTVNSLLKDLTSGEVVDLTGQGKADIKKGIIRTPLDPNIIFSEDPLRMLRAIRFTVKYGWDLPLFMIRAIKKNAKKINSISAERIRDEFDKMLVTKKPKLAVRLLKTTGLMQHIMPELNNTVGVTQNKYHTTDVWNHLLDVVEKVPSDVTKRLAALFHDIGKPTVKSVIDNEVHFYEHEDISAEMAEKIMKRLRYPNEVVQKVSMLIKHHMKLKSSGPEGTKMTDKALRKFKRTLGDHLEDVLDLMDADNKSHSGHSDIQNQIKGVRSRLKNLKDAPKTGGSQYNIPIDGNDLKKLGVKPGPVFKKILSAVQDAADDNPTLTKQQALDIVKGMI